MQATFKTLPHAVRDFRTAALLLFFDGCGYLAQDSTHHTEGRRGARLHLAIKSAKVRALGTNCAALP